MPDLADALIHIEEISSILKTGLSRSALACILSLVKGVQILKLLLLRSEKSCSYETKVATLWIQQNSDHAKACSRSLGGICY